MIYEGEFDYLSGTVTIPTDVDASWFREDEISYDLMPFYSNPNDPKWGNILSRVLYHESIHFWQFFSSGYVANLIGDEWYRFKQYERNGEVLPQGASLQNYGIRKESLPFSSAELVECWARYWDVHTRSAAQIIREEGIELPSPKPIEIDRGDLVPNYTSAAYDAVMQGGKNPDLYAAPYRWLLQKTSGDTRFLNFVFPIIAHHAFGSPDPPGVFYNAFEQAIQSAELHELIKQQTGNINLAWLIIWEDVIEKAILPVLREMSMPPYTSGLDVVQRGTLKDHPIFSEYLENIRPLRSHLKLMRKAISALVEQGTDEYKFEKNVLCDMPFHDFWIVFALPGQPEYREVLGRHLPPPRVRFENFIFNAARPVSLRLQEISKVFSNEGVDNNTTPKDRTYESTLNDLEVRIKHFRQAEEDAT
jgi:hypothetical protein